MVELGLVGQVFGCWLGLIVVVVCMADWCWFVPDAAEELVELVALCLVTCLSGWLGTDLVDLLPPVRVGSCEFAMRFSLQLSGYVRDFAELGLPLGVLMLIVEALAYRDLCFELIGHPWLVSLSLGSAPWLTRV